MRAARLQAEYDRGVEDGTRRGRPDPALTESGHGNWSGPMRWAYEAGFREGLNRREVS